MAQNNVTPIPFKPKHIGLIIAGIVGVSIIMSGTYMVDQTEEAVVQRFGKYIRTAGPGLHFKMPFGIERATKVPTQRVFSFQFGFRTEEANVRTRYSSGDFTNESIMLTGDLNIVDVQWIVQLRISNPRNWLFNLDPNQREKTIRDVSQSAINQLVGDRAILNVISSERIQIEDKGKLMIQEVLDKYNIGVRVTKVQLQTTSAPKGAVQDAFEDVNKAIQDKERFINEGKEVYNREIPKAQGEARQMLEVAEGYAVGRVNRAEGDVARFRAVYAEYRQNPRVTRDRLYLEAVEEVFQGDEGFDLIDKNLENFLPLKNIGGN